ARTYYASSQDAGISGPWPSVIIPVVEARSHNRRATGMVNDTTRLLGLDGLAVVAVEDAIPGGPLVHLATAHERYCRGCWVRTVRMREWVTPRPRDLPVAGRVCQLRWRKRRWCCDEPACARRTFTESVTQVPPGARVTVRLRAASGAAVAERNRTK